jgi:hypothetical protein
MVSVLASSAVDRGFEPRSGQTKDYKIGICRFSAKYAALRRKNKPHWFLDAPKLRLVSDFDFTYFGNGLLRFRW